MGNKYRLYIPDLKQVAENFESDGTRIGAENSLNEIASEIRTLSECLFHAQEIVDFFSVNPDLIKIVEIGSNDHYIKFIGFNDAVDLLQEKVT